MGFKIFELQKWLTDFAQQYLCRLMAAIFDTGESINAANTSRSISRHQSLVASTELLHSIPVAPCVSISDGNWFLAGSVG